MLIPPRPNRSQNVRRSAASRTHTAHREPGLIEFWLQPCLGGSSSGSGVQHVSCPSMETFGSMTKGAVPVQVTLSRGATGAPQEPLSHLCCPADTVRTQTTQDVGHNRRMTAHTARHVKQDQSVGLRLLLLHSGHNGYFQSLSVC